MDTIVTDAIAVLKTGSPDAYRIRAIHADSDAFYDMPQTRAELIDQGLKVNGKRVARPMRANAIRGVSRRRGWNLQGAIQEAGTFSELA